MKLQRLRAARQFQRVYEEGARKAGRLVVVYRRPALEESAVGLVVGRRVGKAVVRNRVRRRLREALRQLPLAAGQHVVVAARPAAAGASFWELREELCGLLEALGALDRQGAG